MGDGMNKSIIAILVLSAVMVIGFQNCSKAGFSSAQGVAIDKVAGPNGVSEGHNVGTANPAGVPDGDAEGQVVGTGNPETFPGQSGVDGIQGGHFDLDTSTQIYPFKAGTTTHHVHEYEKKYQTTTIDFFNLIDTKFDEIQKTIPAGKRFVINVVNSSLSPGGVLQINGGLTGVTKFQLGQVYSIGSAPASGDQELQSLRLGFSTDILAHQGLVPTVTGCVRKNDPGKLGEYRSGALTVQALDAANYSIDPLTGAAASGLLWEATVFWHWDGGCY